MALTRGRRRTAQERRPRRLSRKEIALNKTKRLESLQDKLFENLPDADLARMAGGNIVHTSDRSGYYHTHVGNVYDYESPD